MGLRQPLQIETIAPEIQVMLTVSEEDQNIQTLRNGQQATYSKIGTWWIADGWDR